MKPNQSFVIIGVTTKGKKFRPSDWADRLCGIMSAFGSDNRMMYSPYVRPGCTLTGDKTVLVDARLYEIEPLAYHFLVNFANDNDLQIESIDSVAYNHDGQRLFAVQGDLQSDAAKRVFVQRQDLQKPAVDAGTAAEDLQQRQAPQAQVAVQGR